jgi:SAM-dependent methyltransferase
MVVERSRRRCLLCNAHFSGRAFVCRNCADRYRGAPVPVEVLRQFYQQVDIEYPNWANTYGNYNPPHALLEHLDSANRDSPVLEIGAGGGFLLQDLRDRGFRRLTGSDITTTALAEMRSRNPDITVIAADAESLPFGNHSFDVVISSDVIEHLPRVNSHLSEVHRILSPGGQYLFKTPNRHLAQAYYRLRGLYDHHIWHPSMFGPGDLRRLLEGYGFEVTFLAVTELTAAQKRKIPSEIGRKVLSRLPVRLLPTLLRPHLEVVAQRRD